MTVPHQTDRADLLWRIHRHFAESKLTSFCLDAGWEISLCLSWNIWQNNTVLLGLQTTGFWTQSQGSAGRGRWRASSLPQPPGAGTRGTAAQLKAQFFPGPEQHPLLALPRGGAALSDLVHLPSGFEVSNCPVQYFDNIFFLDSSFCTSPKYNSCQGLKQKTLLRKYYWHLLIF